MRNLHKFIEEKHGKEALYLLQEWEKRKKSRRQKLTRAVLELKKTNNFHMFDMDVQNIHTGI